MLKSVRMGRAAATGAITLTLLGVAAAIQAPAANAASRPSASACHKGSFWAWIDASAANFRTGPSTHATSRGLLHEGDRVAVTCATDSGWFYGKALDGHRGQWGWVHHSVVLNNH